MKKTVKITALIMAMCLILSSCGAGGETPIYSQGLDDNGRYTGVTASDYVTLPDYETIDIPEDELKQGVEYLLSLYAPSEQITGRAVEYGDRINIEYIGYVDGVEFEGGSTGEGGTMVTIGVTSYIDDFLDQLVGHMPGETVNVEVTFPTPYESNEELSGKDATFITKINYIEGEMMLDACDDAFVAENYSAYGWSSIKDLEDYCRSNYCSNYVFENAEVSEIPEAVRNHTLNLIMENYKARAESYGYTFEELLEEDLGVSSVEEFASEYSEYIDSEARYPLIYQALAEKEDIKVKKSDIREYFKNNFGSSYYTDYKNEYGLGYLAFVVMHGLVEDAVSTHVAVK